MPQAECTANFTVLLMYIALVITPLELHDKVRCGHGEHEPISKATANAVPFVTVQEHQADRAAIFVSYWTSSSCDGLRH